MKKIGSLNFATTRQQAGKSSNWKFGWAASSVEAGMDDRRTFSHRVERSGTGVYGMLVSKPSSGW